MSERRIEQFSMMFQEYDRIIADMMWFCGPPVRLSRPFNIPMQQQSDLTTHSIEFDRRDDVQLRHNENDDSSEREKEDGQLHESDSSVETITRARINPMESSDGSIVSTSDESLSEHNRSLLPALGRRSTLPNEGVVFGGNFPNEQYGFCNERLRINVQRLQEELSNERETMLKTLTEPPLKNRTKSWQGLPNWMILGLGLVLPLLIFSAARELASVNAWHREQLRIYEESQRLQSP